MNHEDKFADAVNLHRLLKTIGECEAKYFTLDEVVVQLAIQRGLARATATERKNVVTLVRTAKGRRALEISDPILRAHRNRTGVDWSLEQDGDEP